MATDVIARNAELAGLLGADLQGQLVTEAKADFAALPAAVAGQVYPWEFMSMDYRGQAIVLGNLAEHLAAARKVV